MTVNTQISAEGVGSSYKGNGVLPQKLTCASTTTAFVVSAKLVNGENGNSVAKPIRLWYVSFPEDITAAVAAATLQHCARYLDVVPKQAGNATVRTVADVETVAGEYVYLWCDIPTYPEDSDLTVYITELP